MNRHFKHIIYLILAIALVSCETFDARGNLASKTFDVNGQEWRTTVRTHFANDIYYRATEVPVAYYLLKQKEELGSSLDSIVKATERERIVEFEFEHFDGFDLLESQYTARDYDKSVEYMAFKIENDFKVVTSSNDTITCAGAHFERHFEISSFNRVLLYFNDIAPEETIQLIYQDRLFNNGIFKFKFEETPLKM